MSRSAHGAGTDQAVSGSLVLADERARSLQWHHATQYSRTNSSYVTACGREIDPADVRDELQNPSEAWPKNVAPVDGCPNCRASAMGETRGVVTNTASGVPTLPDHLHQILQIGRCHTVVFTDGSTYTLSGLQVLLAFVRHGRSRFNEWEGAVIDSVEDWHDDGEIGDPFEVKVEPGDSMADLAEKTVFDSESEPWLATGQPLRGEADV